MSAPIRNRATNMGTSHHLLLFQKKENNSPTIPKRAAVVRAVFAIPIIPFLNSSERIAVFRDDHACSLRLLVPRLHCREGQDGLDQYRQVLSSSRTRHREKQNCRLAQRGAPPHGTLPPS